MHHSDRGVQYACGNYVQMVEGAGGQVSMSRPGNPYDNAFCESFIGKLKQEQWDGRRYATVAEARTDLRRILEEVYNAERIHSALGYLTPAEFEQQVVTDFFCLTDGVRVTGCHRMPVTECQGA